MAWGGRWYGLCRVAAGGGHMVLTVSGVMVGASMGIGVRSRVARLPSSLLESWSLTAASWLAGTGTTATGTGASSDSDPGLQLAIELQYRAPGNDVARGQPRRFSDVGAWDAGRA